MTDLKPYEDENRTPDAKAERKAARAKAFADRFERTRHRRLNIEATDNPSPHLDYVITLRTEITLRNQNSPVKLVIRYVPDKHIMSPEGMESYMANLRADSGWDSLESVATAISDDFKNELLTRWCHVVVKGELIIDGIVGEHSIFSEDRLPGWDNEKLLSRLDLS